MLARMQKEMGDQSRVKQKLEGENEVNSPTIHLTENPSKARRFKNVRNNIVGKSQDYSLFLN